MLLKARFCPSRALGCRERSLTCGREVISYLRNQSAMTCRTRASNVSHSDKAIKDLPTVVQQEDIVCHGNGIYQLHHESDKRHSVWTFARAALLVA